MMETSKLARDLEHGHNKLVSDSLYIMSCPRLTVFVRHTLFKIQNHGWVLLALLRLV